MWPTILKAPICYINPLEHDLPLDSIFGFSVEFRWWSNHGICTDTERRWMSYRMKSPVANRFKSMGYVLRCWMFMGEWLAINSLPKLNWTIKLWKLVPYLCWEWAVQWSCPDRTRWTKKKVISLWSSERISNNRRSK